MIAFPTPQHMPCPHCGQSVDLVDEMDHVCDSERKLNYEMIPLLREWEDDLRAWLDSPEGLFESWCAERSR